MSLKKVIKNICLLLGILLLAYYPGSGDGLGYVILLTSSMLLYVFGEL